MVFERFLLPIFMQSESLIMRQKPSECNGNERKCHASPYTLDAKKYRADQFNKPVLLSGMRPACYDIADSAEFQDWTVVGINRDISPLNQRSYLFRPARQDRRKIIA